MSATIELRGVADVPKSHLQKKIKRRAGNDIAYLAPVLCKKCSCLISEDSVELRVNELLFDVAEMCARGLRRNLNETTAQMNINNVNTMIYSTAKTTWDKKMREIFATIYQDVLIYQKDNAYTEWRSLVDEMLEENEVYATQPEEIERLRNGSPIEDGSVEPTSIMGNLRNDTPD